VGEKGGKKKKRHIEYAQGEVKIISRESGIFLKNGSKPDWQRSLSVIRRKGENCVNQNFVGNRQCYGQGESERGAR